MPADAPVFVEAAVRPEGEHAENLDALLATSAAAPDRPIGDPGDR